MSKLVSFNDPAAIRERMDELGIERFVSESPEKAVASSELVENVVVDFSSDVPTFRGIPIHLADALVTPAETWAKFLELRRMEQVHRIINGAWNHAQTPISPPDRS